MKHHLKKESPIDWGKSIPFFIVWGIAIIGPFFTGISLAAITVAAVLYVVRMFFVTGFLHRYFSHKSFSTSRFWQFVFAVLACTAVQKSPVWWASVHRHHHQYSDEKEDPHSNFWYGIWESHFVWILRRDFDKTNTGLVRDLVKVPEIYWLDRYQLYLVPAILLGVACFILGRILGEEYSTSGTQMLIVGFFFGTFVLHHGTFCINSLAHVIGRKRYETKDESRNSFILALITLGEGWHNNHHHQQALVRQGHRWWEIDITFYVLWVMSKLGIIWKLRYK